MPHSNARNFYVYLLSNATRRLYVGVTNNLERRMHEHRAKLVPGFTSKYNISWLVYYEITSDVTSALEREKQIKTWRRSRKTLDRNDEPKMEGPVIGVVGPPPNRHHKLP